MTRNYEAEAREIAEFLNVGWYPWASSSDTFSIGAANMSPSHSIWSALLRLARRPRGLPAEVPEGHERVRIGFNYARDIRGDWYVKDGFYKIFSDFVPSMYDGAAVFDVPLPKSVKIVGSVE